LKCKTKWIKQKQSIKWR